MSDSGDFLGRLAARAQGQAPLALPRPRSRYEPGPAVPPSLEATVETVDAGQPEPEAAPAPPPPTATALRPPTSVSSVSSLSSVPSSVSSSVLSVPPPPSPASPPERRPSVALPRERVGESHPRIPLASPAFPESPPSPPTAFPTGVPTGAERPRPEIRTAAAPEPLREVPFPADWRHGRTLTASRPLPAAPRRAMSETSETAEPSPTSDPSGRSAAPELPNALATLSPRPLDVLPPLPPIVGESVPPVVEVHIDRIEVRAPAPAAPARGPAPAFVPQLSLADYLKARGERRR